MLHEALPRVWPQHRGKGMGAKLVPEPGLGASKKDGRTRKHGCLGQQGGQETVVGEDLGSSVSLTWEQ